MIGDTLNRTSITSNLVISKESDPKLGTLIPGMENMFMMGLTVKSFNFGSPLDLIEGPRIFSVGLRVYGLEYTVPSFLVL
jgi:hypothetical protein